MNEVPSVTMKAGTLSLAMMTPLMKPTIAAPPTPAANPTRTDGKQRDAGIEGAADRQRREDRGEAHHPSDREIDAGGDDDEGLAEPEQQHGDDRDQNVLGIADGEKIDRAARRQRHRDDEKEHHDAKENPSPDAAEEERRALRSVSTPGGAAAWLGASLEARSVTLGLLGCWTSAAGRESRRAPSRSLPTCPAPDR